jgi:hypothetical protein
VGARSSWMRPVATTIVPRRSSYSYSLTSADPGAQDYPP